jgi:N-acetylglucosamine-6-phosphate deacetylase
VTKWLVNQNIRVAAGHTNASLDQLHCAIDAGLSGFTHLGNGCPIEMHRHDNIIQRVFHFRESLWVSLIADGAHLPSWVLKNFIDILGLHRTLVVTDAISAAGLGPGRYKLGPREVVIGSDGVPRSEDNSHFIGSAATMPVCDLQLRQIGLGDTERQALLSANPRRFLGLD